MLRTCVSSYASETKHPLYQYDQPLSLNLSRSLWLEKARSPPIPEILEISFPLEGLVRIRMQLLNLFLRDYVVASLIWIFLSVLQ
ncbi:hypothetical protein VNO77_03233 [Canavalia gladiata]|uniref:Uncharacterized protein n=1 Tax=Canavalia gladiata TaxID=3824 RepID=A0AAN9R6M6_CANGL